MEELCASKVAGSIDILSSALTNCLPEMVPGTTTCSSACATGLQTLRNDLGNCINSIFNATLDGGSSASVAFGACSYSILQFFLMGKMFC